MKELSGAKTMIGADDVNAVEEGLLSLCHGYFYGLDHYEPFKVDTPLMNGDVVHCGDISIHCHHTPGHTKGTFSFTFDLDVEGKESYILMQ
jgi:metallo-beta-lactamase class B